MVRVPGREEGPITRGPVLPLWFRSCINVPGKWEVILLEKRVPSSTLVSRKTQEVDNHEPERCPVYSTVTSVVHVCFQQ